MKLHLGCGDIYLEGWVNIDAESPAADLQHDVTTPLPYPDGSVDFIYSEHMIEHLTVDDGVRLLAECRRLLRQGGVVRMATIDLDYLVFRYFFGWKKQDWITTFNYTHLKTKAEMLNLCFHEWGHQYLYNKEELLRRFSEAGFVHMTGCKRGSSRFPELRGLETRKDSRLVIEATKHH